MTEPDYLEKLGFRGKSKKSQKCLNAMAFGLFKENQAINLLKKWFKSESTMGA